MNKQNCKISFSFSFHRIIIYIFFLMPFVFIFIIFIQRMNYHDGDLWWHLKTGEYILNNYYVPKFDIFSYIPTNRWINQSWLSEIIFFSVFNQFGMNGLIFLKIIILSMAFTIIFTMVYSKKLYIFSVYTLLLVVFASSHTFITRPQIFSFLFTAIYFYILHRYKYKNSKFIFVLPILQIFWTNLHDGSLIGLIIIFSYLIGEVLAWKMKLPFQWNNNSIISGKRYYILLGIAIVTMLTSIVNPNGLIGAFHSFSIFIGPNRGNYQQVMRSIAEWRPPFTIYNFFKVHPYISYKLIIIMSLFGFILNFKRVNISYLLIYIIFLVSSLMYIRIIPIFAILAIPMTLFNIENTPSLKLISAIKKNTIHNFRLRNILSNLTLQILLIASIIILISKLFVSQYYFRNRIISSNEFDLLEPKGAIDFIQKNYIQGNIFNNFEIGGYLIWKLFPHRKIFIDGRINTLYNPRFVLYYYSLFSNPKEFNKAAEHFNINFILLSRLPFYEPFLKYLYKNESWKIIYIDKFAVVFIKDSPLNKDIIMKYSDISNFF